VERAQWSITFIICVCALCFIAAAPAVTAAEKKTEIPFAEAGLFIELNNTDGDLGIHALIDGKPWKRLTLESPGKQDLLNIFVRSRLRRQGLAEVALESAEPAFDELAPAQFFRRFPQGEYHIKGITIDGQEMLSVAVLKHLLPAPPEGISANGANLPEGCRDKPVTVAPDGQGRVVIAWLPVTHSHPNLGITNEPIVVEQYMVVVEEVELGLIISQDLPPNVTQVTLPSDFLGLGKQFKLEILVKEGNGNKTAVETCFAIETP
jgi:hypothetical protein